MNRRSGLRALVLALSAACFLTGCGGEPKPASTLTQDQRDTVLSKSDIPGGRAVGHAFDAAGKEASHAAELDSLTH